jgi:hypothetical protein
MNRRKTGEAETILSHLVQKGRKEKDERDEELVLGLERIGRRRRRRCKQQLPTECHEEEKEELHSFDPRCLMSFL